MQAIYHRSRRYGSAVVLLTLALSLVVDFGGVGLMGALLAVCALTSRGQSIFDSIGRFDRPYRMSHAGKTYILIVLYVAVILFLTFYHQDEMGVAETAIKVIIIAYAIFFHLNRYDAAIVFVGAAMGALLASGAAVYDYYFLSMDRAEGVTNPIRFGFIAALFGALSLVGFLFDRRSRAFTILTAAGSLAGLLAAYLSASMGTALAIPPMLFMIFFRLWSKSRTHAASITLMVLALLGSLVATDIGSMRSRIALALDSIQISYQGDTTLVDESVRLRAKMLQISGHLFSENPLLGVGTNGWNAAVEASANTDGFAGSELRTLNQAHNQIANDLAKGGIVRGLAGMALMFLPLYFFIRSGAFSNDPKTVPALAGVVTCVGFTAVGMTESLLVLSLPACIYTTLLCYLMAQQESASGSAG
jgi:O-antigen ligase